MKKIFYFSLLFLFFGCSEYALLGYDKVSGNSNKYYYKVGYLIGLHPRHNNLPKRCLILYLRDKDDVNKEVNIIGVNSNLYGKLDAYKNEVFDFGRTNNLYLRNLEFEKQNISKEKIKNDTIKVEIKEGEVVRTIEFFGN